MSAWTQIVQGPESDFAVAPVADVAQTSPVDSSDGNAGSKKPAWSKNPAPEGDVAVMSADLWPPLSQSTKKLSPSSSSSDLGSSQKPTTDKANHSVTVTANHGQPTRQKSMKREGRANAQANSVLSHSNSMPREGPHNRNSSVKTIESSGRELGAGKPNGDHHNPRNSVRRGNGGTQQNYEGRRTDQERDWYNQRGFNGRDAPLQPRVDPRGYMRPPPVSSPYVAPMRPPFMNPMVMPDMSMIYFHQGVPYVAPVPPPPPPMYVPVPDLQLRADIVIQIEYYFSDANLVKDTYLRKKMDKDGWVPIALIASFGKVKELTNNIQLILNVLQSSSSMVEVKAFKIRRRGDYRKWIIPADVEFSTSQSPNMSDLSAHFHNVTLDENASMLRSSRDLNNFPSAIDVGATSGRY